MLTATYNDELHVANYGTKSKQYPHAYELLAGSLRNKTKANIRFN